MAAGRSYGKILKSSAFVGGSSLLNVLIGMDASRLWQCCSDPVASVRFGAEDRIATYWSSVLEWGKPIVSFVISCLRQR